MKGLEPPRPETLDPKSNAATNYATCAGCEGKGRDFFGDCQIFFWGCSGIFWRREGGEDQSDRSDRSEGDGLTWPGLTCRDLAGLGSGYFFVRVVCIAFAAARPSPIARITVAPPRTMSPPA